MLANMHAFDLTFSQYIQSEDTLVLAVSGGVDSLVLLDLVMKSHPRERIIVTHFDHSLRGIESDTDRLSIAEFCKREHLVFEGEKMDILTLSKNEQMSIESTARKYRYAFLMNIAQKYHAKYILTAHHLDDRIETALFNLIRGSKLGGIHALSELHILPCHSEERCASRGGDTPENWDGVADDDSSGVKTHTTHSLDLSQAQDYANMQIWLFRPLLSVTKEDILKYAVRERIIYREDMSNTDTTYLRNHLRHNILPLFIQINSEYRRSIESFINYTEELKDWIDEEMLTFLADRQSFSVADFERKSPFFQKEIIRYLYEQSNSGTVGLSEGNIEEIRRYILTANGGTEKQLRGLKLRKKSWDIIVG